MINLKSRSIIKANCLSESRRRMAKDDEDPSEDGGAASDNKTSAPSVTSTDIDNDESECNQEVSDPVSCPEPKSATIPVTPSVTVKTKHQIEEEEREKMQ